MSTDHETDSSINIEEIAREALALAEFADRAPKLLHGLVGAAESLIEITVRDDGRTATGAVKLLLGAQASDRARVLLAALRAANLNLSLVEHLISAPVDGPNTITVTATAGGVTSPLPGSPGGVRHV